MRALRLILFGIIIALFALFSFSNWTRVPVTLPDGTIVSILLPLIVLVAFLLGWIPVLLVHMAARATWRRRTAKVERLLDEALTTQRVVPAVPATAPVATVFPPTP